MRKLIVILLIPFVLSPLSPTRPEPVDEYLGAKIRLEQEIMAMIRMPSCQPRIVNGRKMTFCNISARDLLDNRDSKKYYHDWIGFSLSYYGYDVSSVFPRPIDILTTNINLAYARVLIAIRRGLVVSLTAKQAQERANQGIPIWVIVNSGLYWFGHEAIVCPDWQGYSEDWGPRIGQTGEFPCISHARDLRIFGQHWKNRRILYIEFRQGKESI